MERAAELEQPGFGLTDHGSLFGAAQFFSACERYGIKGLIGMEAYEAVPHTWDPEEHADLFKAKYDPDNPRYFHLTLWVQNRKGWENLCALHSLSYTKDFKPKNQPLIDRAHLEQHSEGLMVGLGCIASRFNRTLASDGPAPAYEAAKWYADVFEDRAYVEVMANLPDQQALLRDQRKVAGRLGLPTVATNDVHYVRREDGVEGGPHHLLVQARRWKKKGGEEQSSDKSDAGYGQWYGSDGFYLKSRHEMEQTGGLLVPELDQTLAILDRTDFDFSALGEPTPPSAPVPEPGEDRSFDKWIELQ